MSSDHLDVMTGSPREVSLRLHGLDADQVLAIDLGHASVQEAQTIAHTVTQIAQLVQLSVTQHAQHTLQSLVDALVPQTPPTPTQLREAAMLVRARTAVLEQGDWLTTTQVAQLAGFSPRNPSAQPHKWKRDRLIFAIRHHGVDYFPGYGLDAQQGYRPLKAMAQVIQTLGAAKDAWGLAYWFASANSFLGGLRPQDLLADQPDRVLAAALDELEGVQHG